MKSRIFKLAFLSLFILIVLSGTVPAQSDYHNCEKELKISDYTHITNSADLLCEITNSSKTWNFSKDWAWTGDMDSDGIENHIELREGLDPLTPNEGDTDNDGFSDKFEAIHPKLDPLSKNTPEELDVNNNGINDQVEFSYGIENFNREFDGEDSDGDGLTDEYEEIIGTDPNKADTDSDGYDDKVELARPGPLPELNPLYKDVVLEVDSMKSRFLRNQYIVTASYTETVDVQNPNGDKGFNIHIIEDDLGGTPYYETLDMDEVASNPSKFIEKDYERYGAIYVLIADNIVRDSNEFDGYALYGSDTVYLSQQTSNHRTLLHELGHIMGLTTNQHRYIDSENASVSEYPSIMNYNVLGKWNPQVSSIKFSDGSEGDKDHDDIQQIEEWFDEQDYAVNDRYGEED